MSIPADWKLEFPGKLTGEDDGSCRRIEDAYERLGALGHGTYGEVTTCG